MPSMDTIPLSLCAPHPGSLVLAGLLSLTMLEGCKTTLSDRCGEADSCSELSEEAYEQCTSSAEATEAKAEAAGCTDAMDRLASCQVDNYECGTEPAICFDDVKAVNDCLRAAGKSSPECQD